MTIHRIPLLLASTLPDSGGDVFFEPSSIKFTNDLINALLCVFNDTGADEKLGFSCPIPVNYVGSLKIVGRFLSTATTGDYVWEVEYRAIASVEDGDPSTFQETVTSSAITVPGTALQETEKTLTLTAGNLAAKDRFTGHILRKGSSGSDTLAAALLAWPDMFQLEYADA